MANRAGLFPILLVVSILFAPIIAHAAEEPVATAPIPPPLPSTPLVTQAPAATTPAPKPPAAATPAPKATATANPIKPSAESAAKKSPSAVSRKDIEHKTAAFRRPHRRSERRQLAARVPPPRPAMWRRYYAAVPVPGPEADGPSFPPPWYDRGRPLAAYPYPGPRGPMPPW